MSLFQSLDISLITSSIPGWPAQDDQPRMTWELHMSWCHICVRQSVPTMQMSVTTRERITLHRSIHYSGVILSAMASQITRVWIVCSTVCSSADQRRHRSSASLAFVKGIHQWLVNFPHKGQVTRKIFPFDDEILFLTKITLHITLLSGLSYQNNGTLSIPSSAGPVFTPDPNVAIIGFGDVFKTLRPRQNGRHFPDDTFKRIFVNESVRISIKISLKFVPKGPIIKIPALV